MGERELMKLRELKEAAHALFARGRYAQCAETYERILRLAPKDPNVRVRHAESCRRAGDRQSAITSYRAAAELLMEQGCESRARGALRAALELDPKDPQVLADLARLGQQAPPVNAMEDERLYSGSTGMFERPGTTSAKGPATPRAPQSQRSPPPPPPPSYVLRAAEETPAPGPLPAVPSIAPLSVDALRAAGRTMAPIPLMNPVRPGNVVPSITPIIQGRLVTQPPVPPPLPSARAAGTGEGAAMKPAAVPPAMRPAGAVSSRPSGATMAPAGAVRPSGSVVAPVPQPARPSGATMAPLPSAGRPAGAPLPRPAVAPGQAASSGSSPLTMVPMPRAGAGSGAGGEARAAAPEMPYRPELRRLGPNAVALRMSPQARWVIIRSDSPLEVSRAVSLPAPAEPQPGVVYAPESRPASPASANH